MRETRLLKSVCAGLAVLVAAFCGISAMAEPAIKGTGEWVESTTSAENDTLTIISGRWMITDELNYSVVCISNGAQLAVGCDNAFATKQPIMSIFGTFDLAGHSVTIRRFGNRIAKDEYQPLVRPCVCNTAAGEVTLTCTSTDDSNYFYGDVREMPGKINLVFSANARLIGPDGAAAVKSLTLNNKSVMLEHSQGATFLFVLKAREGSDLLMRLSEITLTCKGAPVPAISEDGIVVSSEYEGNSHYNVADGKANTYWRAATSGDQWVKLSVPLGTVVDGYRVTPAPKTGDNDYNPVGWDVYSYRADETGWMIADTQRDVVWPRAHAEGKSPHATSNFYFRADLAPGSVFGPGTALTLNSSSVQAFRVSTRDPIVVGSVAGQGGLRVEASGFNAASFDDFTGPVSTAHVNFRRFSTLGLLADTSSELRVPNLQNATNLLVVNGGTAPVSVKLDDRETTHLFGSLADGSAGGQLGLVKTGSGTRIIETEAADYTGPTEVREGTLVVAARRKNSTYPDTVTAKYIKVVPLLTKGGPTYADTSGYNWAIGCFQLIDKDGNNVTMTLANNPETPVGFLDANNAKAALTGSLNRCLVKNAKGSTDIHPVILTFSSPVTFSGYTWSPDRHDNAQMSRNPITLGVYISDDKTNWQLVGAEPHEHTKAWADEKLEARGPDRVRNDFDAMRTGSQVIAMGESFLVTDNPQRASRGKLKSKYFRFRVFGTTDPECHENAFGWYLCEIGLMKNGQRVDWPAGTRIELYGGELNKNNNSKLEALVDNVIWEPDEAESHSTRNGGFIMSYPSHVVITTPAEVEFDSYSLISTGRNNYYLGRLPSAWDFSVSGNGSNWYPLDWKGEYRLGVDYTITKAYQEMGPFPVANKYPLGDRGCCDAIGDRSPVSIAAGATLGLKADFERFGALSGAGTLDLDWGAVAEINAFTPATFSGKVTATGTRSTLVVSGTNVQTFATADLSGVATLELEGTIAGTASFGGEDVTVAFNGGATAATLSDIGKLTVTGDVKLALSDDIVENGGRVTLFTYDSIDASGSNLATATLVPPPTKKRNVEVTIGEKSTVVTVSKRGIVLFVR